MKSRLIALLIPLISACGSEEAPPPLTIEERAAASARLFRDIFKAGEYARIPEAEAAMLEIYKEDPQQAEVVFLLGSMYFWSVAEWRRDPSRGTEAQHDQLLKMEKYLSEAVQLRPEDGRGWCFLGAGRLTRGLIGRNQPLFLEGTANVDKCAELYPHFGLLMVVITNSFQPVGSDLFKKGVDAVWKNTDVCVEDTIDRLNPDFRPYQSQTTRLDMPFYACWNSPGVPHNLDTFWLIMGDMLVKDGQLQAARVVYENVKLDPAFETWKFKDYYYQRVADIEQRAALYRDSNPANDPPVILQEAQCVICHSN